MLQLIGSLCALFISSFVLLSEAQFFDTDASSLGRAPVGFVNRFGAYGDRESIASLGGSPVGVYQRRQYPFQPVYPFYPGCHFPGPCHHRVVQPARPPLVPVKTPCQLPGPCPGRVVKPDRPPPARPYKKPAAVRPPVSPRPQKGKGAAVSRSIFKEV